MESNSGKKLHTSFEQAERAAKAMRTRHNENFQPIKVDGGWVVGGSHVKSKTPYKRVKSFVDIRALFDDIAESISETDVVEYAKQIDAESATSKVSEVNGQGEHWKLVSWQVMSGRQLQMNNDTSYLVLTVENAHQTLQIQMGGVFSRHIPLISAQAESLRGRGIVWHTWNSARQPAKWERSKWFYMIEPVDA
ncbi:MAG: hypothetical protein HS128_11185 [Ideonella sp.]|nr:hypothetical protein [Ideonella sp.]